MPWSDYPLQEIVIPADHGPTDPYVYVGQDDPLAAQEQLDGSIVFYAGNGQAFLLAVGEDISDPTNASFFSLLSYDGSFSHDVLKVHQDTDTPTVRYVRLGQHNSGGAYLVKTLLTGSEIALGVNGEQGDTDITIFGNQLPRGYMDVRTSGANVDCSTATEVTGGTVNDANSLMTSDRLYAAEFDCRVISTVVGDRIGLKVWRNGTTTGTLVRDLGQVTIKTASVAEPVTVRGIFQGAGGDTITVGARRVGGAGTCTIVTQSATLKDLTAA